MANYKHSMYYTLPVKPSPNLNTQQAIMLYPSVCMFEATYLNHGRGTYFPFTVFGAPYLKGIVYAHQYKRDGGNTLVHEPGLLWTGSEKLRYQPFAEKKHWLKTATVTRQTNYWWTLEYNYK